MYMSLLSHLSVSRRSQTGLMVGALDSELSGPASSPAWVTALCSKD